MYKRLGLAFGLAGLLATAVASAAQPTLNVTATKFDAPPTLDGILNDPQWVQASINGSKLVEDINNTGDAITSFPRTVYLGYDNQNLYVAVSARTADSSALVTIPGSSNTDELELFVQPDLSNAFTFYHLGIIFDGGLWANEGGPDLSGVKVGHHTTKTSWTVEAAIPFSAFGDAAAPKPGDVWAMGIDGHQIADGAMWVAWEPTGGKFAQPDKFGHVTFGE